MGKKQGLIYVFTGNGKGKTSAALGVTIRMLLTGKKVEWVSWFKESDWKTAEMKLPEVFKENLTMHWMGKGFFGGPADKNTPDRHKKAAEKALCLTKDILSGKEATGGMTSLLVLDEVLRAVDDGLLNVEDLVKVVKKHGTVHLVLTGHSCPSEIKDMADLVTEMKKVKHPYDKGVLAVQGLDF
jgi:cob(I)alamin adenosyltransferase